MYGLNSIMLTVLGAVTPQFYIRLHAKFHRSVRPCGKNIFGPTHCWLSGWRHCQDDVIDIRAGKLVFACVDVAEMCNNKNLAIANRSRVSCAHNTLINITPWRYKSLKVTGNRTIGQIIHNLLLVELFDVKYYRDLKMLVRGHSRSLKLVPFNSVGAVSYSPSMVTMAVSVAVCEIFSVKEWCDLENRVTVRSRSLKMAPLDR